MNHWVTPICLFTLLVSTAQAAVISSDRSFQPCLVDACISRYKQSLDEIGKNDKSASMAHCLILKSYRQCLTDSFQHCLTQLDFHSATTTAARRWDRFECDQQLITLIGEQQHQQGKNERRIHGEPLTITTTPSKCAGMPNLDGTHEEEEEDVHYDADSSTEDYYSHEMDNKRHQNIKQKNAEWSSMSCTIFGQLHLVPLHASSPVQFDQCSFVGARPLIDNQFFLIQITAGDLLIPLISNSSKQIDMPKTDAKLLGITNIALIIRPLLGCIDEQMLYLADATDHNDPTTTLPLTFVDGTSHYGAAIASGKKAVEIIGLTNASVQICLNYINTDIVIQSIGNRFFNIFVHLMHQKKMEKEFDSSFLCATGCQNNVKIMDKNAPSFANNIEIGELCARLVERLAAKNGEQKEGWHNLISGICAQDLARASTTAHAFPMSLWLDSLYNAADKLEADHANFYRESIRDNNYPSIIGDKSNVLASEHSSNKNMSNQDEIFEWHSTHAKHGNSASFATGKLLFNGAFTFSTISFITFLILFGHCIVYHCPDKT